MCKTSGNADTESFGYYVYSHSGVFCAVSSVRCSFFHSQYESSLLQKWTTHDVREPWRLIKLWCPRHHLSRPRRERARGWNEWTTMTLPSLLSRFMLSFLPFDEEKDEKTHMRWRSRASNKKGNLLNFHEHDAGLTRTRRCSRTWTFLLLFIEVTLL